MFAVVMAGGSGTRFWPASREKLPKQFLRITSNSTLFEETLDRVRLVAAESETLVVIHRMHEEIAGRLAEGRSVRMLSEPVGRNTAACIGLAALHVARQGKDQTVAVFPADHYVSDVEAFAQTVKAAAQAAESGGIVTIGVPPTRPETGFGYIEVGRQIGRALDHPVFGVARFLEKPDVQSASAYLADGRYLWNSGIFVFKAETILAEIEHHLPNLFEGLRAIDGSIGTDRYPAVLERVYAQLEPISIDYGVMERAERPVCVIRAEFSWSDVGSWKALYELRSAETDRNGNLLLCDAVAVDARGSLVYSSGGRLIALLGVRDLVVVDTPDALMIADIDRSQEVRALTEILKKNKRDEVC